MASQTTSLTIIYSTVYSGVYQRKHQNSASLAFVMGNSPVTGEFPSQRASNAGNVSIWWRHHDLDDRDHHTLHNKSHGCWCPASGRHGIHPVVPEYYGFSTKKDAKRSFQCVFGDISYKSCCFRYINCTKLNILCMAEKLFNEVVYISAGVSAYFSLTFNIYTIRYW